MRSTTVGDGAAVMRIKGSSRGQVIAVCALGTGLIAALDTLGLLVTPLSHLLPPVSAYLALFVGMLASLTLVRSFMFTAGAHLAVLGIIAIFWTAVAGGIALAAFMNITRVLERNDAQVAMFIRIPEWFLIGALLNGYVTVPIAMGLLWIIKHFSGPDTRGASRDDSPTTSRSS